MQHNRNVPFFSFLNVPSNLKEEWFGAIQKVLEKGRFIGGEEVSKFEDAWARMLGVKFAVGVGNGLDGLVLSLKALGVGEGDRVAVPSHTFIATWNAVKIVGATPVGIDVDSNGLLNLDLLEQQSNLKCVIPVHMHGAMVDMSRLATWANLNQVLVIEDASQAHLAKSEVGYAGSLSDVGVFSLYPSKNLGALGDAGVITTNNAVTAESIRSYANYGADTKDKYFHKSFGANTRLDTIQAGLLNVNLQYLEVWTEHRSALANIYLKNINPSESLKFLHNITVNSVWHHFPIITTKRPLLIEFLAKNGVATEIHYPNLAADEYSRITGEKNCEYPIGKYIANNILSLPISQWHTAEDIQYVASTVNKFESDN